MSWRRLKEFTRTLSFRLNLWYALIFMASAVLLFGLIYWLLSAAIDRKDRGLIEARLREGLAVYGQGGVPAVRDWASRINRAHRHAMFFVRIVQPNGSVPLLVVPDDWSDRDLNLLDHSGGPSHVQWRRLARDLEMDLTIETATLPDDSVLQMGRSGESRADLLRKFRQVFLLVIPPVILLAFTGGSILTRRTMRPVRNVVHAASAIINTGRMDVRVPTRETADELQDLVVLFNQMLESNESLFRALRESLDNVAHDLRTPLSRLRATLENAVLESADAKTQENIGDALEETERVGTIIHTLMDVAEAESGLMTLQLQPTEIRTLIDEVLNLYDQVLEEKSLAIATDFPEPLILKLDPARMRQAFANLLDNAIKYTPAAGKISIFGERRGDRVEVSFRDTGQGIAEADLPHIWERLYRADKSRSEHGLGLGLSLVKAIVQAHNGSVEVKPAQPVGSTFTIYLPISDFAAKI